MMATRLHVFLLAIAIWGLMLGESHAGIVQVASRSALGANDLIDWGDYGSNGTFLNNPFNATSDGGLVATVSKNAISGSFQTLVQGQGWGGNFSPGETILWTNSYSDSAPKAITMTFDQLVSGVGLNIQQANAINTPGRAFTATMDVFGSTNNYLGQITVTGDTTTANDGSAVFLGFKSTATDVQKIIVSVSAAPFNYVGTYGINQVSLITPADVSPPNAQPVPAPSSLLVGTIGIFLLGFRRLQRTAACWC